MRWPVAVADAAQRHAEWIDDLRGVLPDAATVLDLGCGCGVPVARALAALGHVVTGVDVSEVQIDRTRRLVASATFLHADATRDFAAGSFDAVVCLYVLIHLPQPAQQRLLHHIATWLRPGGWLLTSTGASAWTGVEESWLGGSEPMWWSHPDADTYRRWLNRSGFTIHSDTFSSLRKRAGVVDDLEHGDRDTPGDVR